MRLYLSDLREERALYGKTLAKLLFFYLVDLKED